MEIDRFKNYDSDVRQLVLEFETMLSRGQDQFFDVAELEIIIDYYLDSSDIDNLQESVCYALSLYPDSSEIRLRKAHLCLVSNKFEEAKSILDALVKVEPDDTDILYALGAYYSSINQPRMAIEYFQKAASDGYEMETIYANIGDEYYNMSEYDSAIEYYQKALSVNPSDARIIINLCLTYFETTHQEDGVPYFQKFVEDHPYSIEGWFSLGKCFMVVGCYEKAIDAFEYALAIDDNYFPAYAEISECFRFLEDYGKAVSYLREAVHCAPEPALLYYNIGVIYHSIKNYESAVIYFRKSAEVDPSSSETWMSIAGCYSSMEDYGAAIEYANRAMALNPKSSLHAWQTACIHDHFNNPEEADPLYRCAIQLDSECDENWLDYGDFLMRQERYDDAIELLQEGIVGALDQFAFNQRLAICYYRTGKRNFLFNTIWACMAESHNRIEELLQSCPEMGMDIDVMNIVNSQ